PVPRSRTARGFSAGPAGDAPWPSAHVPGPRGKGAGVVVHLANLVEVRGVRGVSGRQLVPPEGTTAGDDLYRQIFERNRTVQLLIDPAPGRIVDANPAACRFYGYSRADLTTRKISDINDTP